MGDPTQLETSNPMGAFPRNPTGDYSERRNHLLKRTNDCLERSNNRLEPTNDSLENPTKRRIDTDPASARVLGTTELLEAMLLQLPMRDLLFAQRVSKGFQEVIVGSPAIQRLLYFQPEIVSPGAAEDEPVVNPLLQRTWANTRNRPVVMSHDGLMFAISGYRPGPVALRISNIKRTNWMSVSEVGKPRCFTRGSWRRMYVTQPPGPLFITRLGSDDDIWIPTAKRLGELWRPHCYGSGDAFWGEFSTGDLRVPEVE